MKYIFTLLGGILMGLLISQIINTEKPINYYENYILTLNTKKDMQLNFMNFYINHYCKNNDVRRLPVQAFGTTFDGIYCNKSTVMLLDNDLPMYIEALEE